MTQSGIFSRGGIALEIPIYIAGERCGTLTERAEGLYTVLRAVCPPKEGLIRLWARGGGRSGYLGLLTPCGDGLALERRLSRRERAAFPAVIERADDGEAPAAPDLDRDEPCGQSWRRLPDGSLRGENGLLALPAALPDGSPLRAALQHINGGDYLVFRL